MRVTRKVKIDGAWIFAAAPLDRNGKPDSRHVLYKGKRIAVDGGTFYLDHGHGKSRKRVKCGTDPEAVKRAMKTQTHVLELRRRGMDVPDAQEIVDSRRGEGGNLRELARAFVAEPPAGFTKKTVAKYRNAFESFAAWAAPLGIFGISQVTQKIILRWVNHLKGTEKLDASTIVPKVRIILGELKRHGNEIKLEDRSLPKITTPERDIYTADELEALFAVCGHDENELYQVFLLTGLRFQEVAHMTWDDVDAKRRTIEVKRKKDLAFTPKAYHERTVPVPPTLIELLQKRGERLASDGVGLVFPTSTAWSKRKGSEGGKPDRKMLDKLKQLALRSGLNCGRCRGSHKNKPVTCATHAVCKVWGLHKFRHTYATWMLRDKVDIVTVSKWLGHKDLATTRIYLRALEAEMAQPQVEASSLATRFGGRVPLPTHPVPQRARPPRSRPESPAES